MGSTMADSKTVSYITKFLVPEWEKLFREKNAGYGDMHQELGTKAQYVDLHRKIGKLRRALWEGQDIGAESAREVLLDLIGHAFLTIQLIDREEEVWDEQPGEG